MHVSYTDNIIECDRHLVANKWYHIWQFSKMKHRHEYNHPPDGEKIDVLKYAETITNMLEESACGFCSVTVYKWRLNNAFSISIACYSEEDLALIKLVM